MAALAWYLKQTSMLSDFALLLSNQQIIGNTKIVWGFQTQTLTFQRIWKEKSELLFKQVLLLQKLTTGPMESRNLKKIGKALLIGDCSRKCIIIGGNILNGRIHNIPQWRVDKRCTSHQTGIRRRVYPVSIPLSYPHPLPIINLPNFLIFLLQPSFNPNPNPNLN